MALRPITDQRVAAVAKPAQTGAVYIRRAEGVLAAMGAAETIRLTPTLHSRLAGVFQSDEAVLGITENLCETCSELGTHITTRGA